jgi:hypothetical protein
LSCRGEPRGSYFDNGDPFGHANGRRQWEPTDFLVAKPYFGTRWSAFDHEFRNVGSNRLERASQHREVFRHPRVIRERQCFSEVLFGIQPVAECHLTKPQLGNRPRRSGKLEGLLEQG